MAAVTVCSDFGACKVAINLQFIKDSVSTQLNEVHAGKEDMPVFAFLSVFQNLYSMSEHGRNLRNKTL